MSKKLPILLSTLLLGMFSVQVIANDEQPETAAKNERSPFDPFAGRITGSKVRLRVQPTLEGHVVREIAPGELFAVMGEENDYYSVAPTKGTKGYVFRTFILDGLVEGDRVNVRLYPDTDAPIIARLNTGDRVDAVVSDANNKWLEIDVPESCRFYVAKEYIEQKGAVEMIAQMEKRHHEATHHLSSAFLFAQSELQKPFEQIDFENVCDKFAKLVSNYNDIPDVTSRAQEANGLIQDLYIQKKIAFLEKRAARDSKPLEANSPQLEKLAALGIDVRSAPNDKNFTEIGDAATVTLGLSATLSDEELTDKMLSWQPFEESLYHLWAAARGECSMEEFYEQEEMNAAILTGIVEPYTRPVKNRPGDFLLKNESLPIAFLYSTRINLEKLVGKKVTVIASPRPNNQFAFPAYYVLSIE